MDQRLSRYIADCLPEARTGCPDLTQLLERVEADYRQLEAECSRLREENAQASRALEDKSQKLKADEKERKRLEVNLRHAEKLRAVGQLAAGIAHEINTPIQFVGDSVHFLREAFEDLTDVLNLYRQARQASPEEQAAAFEAAVSREEEVDLPYLAEQIPKAFDRTLDGVRRVTEIVRAMRDFAHPERKERVLADLNAGLVSTLTVARNELKYVADVRVDLGNLPQISCLPNELNQVFLNLLVNAAHAIADRFADTEERGTISVATSVVGDYVVVAIADNGCGIPESVRDRVYDPFFTTKGVGRGSGQGLSIARSIVVDQHHGTLTFKSEVGVGTTFYVRLPIRHEESLDTHTVRLTAKSGELSIHRS